MIQIEVGGHNYQISKLNALQQFHLMRRLGPMLIVAGVTVEALHQGMKVEMSDLVAMAGPVMEILSRMEDSEVDYVVNLCMGAVRRQQGEAWAPMLEPQTKKLMFADMEMPEMIRVCLEVIKENLANFLTGLGDGLNSPSSSVLGQPQPSPR